jgi:hypothetical protein
VGLLDLAGARRQSNTPDSVLGQLGIVYTIELSTSGSPGPMREPSKRTWVRETHWRSRGSPRPSQSEETM